MAHIKEDDDLDENNQELLLVTEFPPPVFYYKYAEHLKPPPIPHDDIIEASKNAIEILKKAKEEAERNRSNVEQEELKNHDNTTSLEKETVGTSSNVENVQLDGKVKDESDLNNKPESKKNTIEEGDKSLGGASIDQDNEASNAVFGGIATAKNQDEFISVFGEIVEDPLLAPVEDDCENPMKIRREVERINRNVLERFVELLHELVNRPLGNKKYRDELSHSIFLMIQECNKFREHQARERLIDILEKQLQERKTVLEELNDQISEAEFALANVSSRLSKK